MEETFIIEITTDITQAMLDACNQTNVPDLRKSLDESLAILSWYGEDPAIFDGYTKYDQQGIITIKQGVEWTYDITEDEGSGSA